MGTMRSPHYPAVSLGAAIDLVAKIFREDRTNAIDKEVAAKHMGYTGLTGRTLKLLGALSQFGLLEKVGKGQVRVSKNAVSILHWSDEDEKREALRKAGTNPTLFRRIRTNFDEPSDRTITSFLIKEGFTDTAIPAVLKSLKETNRFLAENGVSEGESAEARPATSAVDDEFDEGEALQMPPPPAVHHLTAATHVMPPVQEEPQGLSVNFDMKSVSISGRTNSPRELREFITSLSALANLFEALNTKVKDLPERNEIDGGNF